MNVARPTLARDFIPNIRWHRARLGKVSVGRSCVRFKRLADLNLDVVRELISLTAASAAEPTP